MPTATSFTLPAGALLPGAAYTADLIFSNRLVSTDANNVDTTVGFDRKTSLSFTTAPAVPEASTTARLGLLLALGIGEWY